MTGARADADSDASARTEDAPRSSDPRAFSAAALRAAGAPRKIVHAASRIDLERARVLDVGCGEGRYLAHFSRASVGVDRSAERVAELRARGLSAFVRDVEQAGWTADLGRFDVVWLCDILVHLRDPGRFLASLSDALAGGGRLWITEWLWPRRRAAAGALALVVPGGRATWTNPEHLHHLTRPSLRALLAENGWEVASEGGHTFRNPLIAALAEPFWPPRTIVATRGG